MFPTTLFGFLLVICAALFVLRPERRFMPLLASLAALTFGSGILGCTVGLIKTFRFVQTLQPLLQVKVAAVGAAESLNNIVLALLFVVFSLLLASIASLRHLRQTGGAQ